MADDYFVKIDDPITTRVTLLESSKEIVKGLQGYHKVLLIRKQKYKQVDLLKSQVKEVILLMNKVEQLLPKEYLPDNWKHYDPKKSEHKSTKVHAGATKHVLTKEEVAEQKMDNLSKTLSSIEKRLESLE